MRTVKMGATRTAWALAAALLAAFVLAPAHAAEGGKVDINAAGSEELQELPGIGPSLAARIIAYREEHGPFRQIEDLMNVQGIGEKSFLKLRDRITVGEKRSERG